MKFVPPEFLKDAHHWLILHGRYVCTARKPACPQLHHRRSLRISAQNQGADAMSYAGSAVGGYTREQLRQSYAEAWRKHLARVPTDALGIAHRGRHRACIPNTKRWCGDAAAAQAFDPSAGGGHGESFFTYGAASRGSRAGIDRSAAGGARKSGKRSPHGSAMSTTRSMCSWRRSPKRSGRRNAAANRRTSAATWTAHAHASRRATDQTAGYARRATCGANVKQVSWLLHRRTRTRRLSSVHLPEVRPCAPCRPLLSRSPSRHSPARPGRSDAPGHGAAASLQPPRPAGGASNADNEAAARHAKRTACINQARAKKLVGAQKTAYIKGCVGAP